MKKALSMLLLVCLMLLSNSCGLFKLRQAQLEGKNIRLEFNEFSHSRIVGKFDGKEIPLGEFASSETLTVAGKEVRDFPLSNQKKEKVQDSIGTGQRLVITGSAPSIKKTLTVTVYDDFPLMAFYDVQYANSGNTELVVNGWTNHQYAISTQAGDSNPPFWSYQSGSYESRPDWVLPLKSGFNQENFLGMNNSDYGGGTPIVDVWRKDIGIGVGHVELAPKLVSLPVTMLQPNQAKVSVRFKKEQTLKPGESLKTLRTFVAVHQGDYFQTLAEYRRFMIQQGVRFNPAPRDAFAPIWCAWGYGRNFTPGQVYSTFPIVKKLGFGWVTLDDGWQTAEGDWFLQPKKFPRGDQDMKAMVDKIHAEGFKAQLWWAPLAVDPGTKLISKHQEQLLLNADGSKQKITWWDSWYLCPADPGVIEYHRKLVEKIIKDWGFDGLKLDGQFMNGAPPCFNPAHRHPYPEASVEAMPAFFKAIYDTARSFKPNALVEFCPCGTAYSFFTLPYMNMAVASDPGSSWQIRLKGKTLKALAGDETAYFGDHVDMSDGGDDFASSVGIGAVIGTNFTWPVGASKDKKLALTPQKVEYWGHWIKIYQEKMLPKGEYLGNLYDIGFDRPETHAIRKDGRIYYAFYSPEWKGAVELRGLESRRFRLTDYETQRDLGTVEGPKATLNVGFKKHLLLEARPE